MASEMVERLAAEFSRKNLEGCEEQGRIEACDAELCRCRFFARAAVEVVLGQTEDDDPAVICWREMIDTALKGA